MTTEPHVVFIQSGERRKPWGQYVCAADAEAAAIRLRLIGLDGRAAPGRIIAGELVLASAERAA